MASVQEIVGKQKDGAQFVISAQMLRMQPEEFDALAQQWIADGGADGFELVGVPHRRFIDGVFFVDRVTAIRTT